MSLTLRNNAVIGRTVWEEEEEEEEKKNNFIT